MALNFNSRHGIIIGAVTLLVGFAIIVSDVPRLYSCLTLGEYSSYFSMYIIYSVCICIFAVLCVIFSILLILGIVKKSHMLLVPWLVVGFLTSALYSCATLYSMMMRMQFSVNDLSLLMVSIGLQVAILCPITNLYAEIRLENSAVNHNGCEKISKNTAA